jgi:uncharacterized membrane protein YgdD (TMEM256/DUF423 family)
MRAWPAAIAVFGGLAGAAGVGLSAYATHSGSGPNLTLAAQFLLFHAGPLLLLGLLALPRMALLVSASVLALGVALFSGDLVLRAMAGHALFPMAAPSGGMLMIAGWLALAVVGATTRRRRSD